MGNARNLGGGNPTDGPGFTLGVATEPPGWRPFGCHPGPIKPIFRTKLLLNVSRVFTLFLPGFR